MVLLNLILGDVSWVLEGKHPRAETEWREGMWH